MAARVQLRRGDMFNGPSDLIVLPCSTIPTITELVRKRLRHFRIEGPERAMQLGEVEFKPFEGNENIAGFVAFAASVEAGYSSEPEAIERIGREVGRFSTREPSVQRIAVPLLGTGAGGLSPEVAVRRLRQGFLATASDRATLNIFVLEEDVYGRLEEEFRGDHDALATAQEGNGGQEPIRVFVSYTRTDEAHATWVKELATFLRENGVDARLDVWHLRRGMNVAQWMCNELDQAHRVLLICNEEYARRADGYHGGVAWEIRLVQGDLLASPVTNSDKYVPVIRAENIDHAVPSFLRATYFFEWPEAADETAKREALLREIYRIQEQAPPLGPPRFAI